MAKVIHFEIDADSPDRAAKFYKTVFGWKIEKWNGPMDYWMIEAGDKKEPGINGGLLQRGSGMKATAHTIGVDSVDAFTKKIEKVGGKICMPKTAIPGVGWFAQCEDTEGNVFAIMQAEKKAGIAAQKKKWKR